MATTTITAPPAPTTSAIPTHDQLPSPTLLSEASSYLLKDASGKETPFKSLYLPTPPTTQRHLLVFIRHFFCGLCEEYIRALSTSLPPTLLTHHNTTLTIIGCGDPICIPDYKTRTSCPYDIYADPTQKLYKKLGMCSNLLTPAKKPGYSSKGMVGIVASSLVNAVKSGSKVLKGGPAAQLGGEWLFEEGDVKWVHRMRNASDHTEVGELRVVLGIAE